MIDYQTLFTLILIGFAAGVLSGMVGVGGGIILVPALVIFLGYSQKMAQGTTLMMLAIPFVIFSVINYHKAGNVNIKTAIILGLGFMGGGYLGSKWANLMPETWAISEKFVITSPLKKIFGVLMIIVALQLLLSKK